jgi:hypothetical protein
MWFDARAALERIGGQERPEPATKGQRDSQNSQNSQGCKSRDTPQAQRDRGQFAEFAGFATPLPQHPFSKPSGRDTCEIPEAARKRAAVFPTEPATCAVCGVADWQVSMTDTDGRRLHVPCWRAEEKAPT